VSAPRGRRATGIAIALLTGVAPAAASTAGFPVRGVGNPAFLLDAVTLPAGGDSVDVEISWQVPLRALAFRPEDDVFRARYEVAFLLLRDGRQVAGELWERRVRARELAGTRDPSRNSHGRKVLRVPAGTFDVRVTVTDRVAGASSEANTRLVARGRDAGIGLSDLGLVRYTEGGVVRNPAHDVPLGETGHAVRATVLSETGAEGSVELRWRITDPGGRRAAEGDSTVALAGERMLVVDVPIASERLAPGLHSLEVRLGAERRTISLQGRVTPAWFEANRRATIEILSLIADEDETDRLEAAEGAQWPGALAAFWERHEISPDTPDQLRREMQERVEAVCTLFVEPFRHPGWKTDRGRIWIRFGRPARRSQSTGDFDRPATEIWEYDAPRRTFVFVDRGSGEYWLSG